MRNFIFIFSVLLCAGLKAQSDIYDQLKHIIRQTHPELNLDDKLLAFNVWSVNDPESREANKSFEKAFTVYEYAKLKGGLKGMVAVAINKDNLTSMATIAYAKDGIHKVISVALENIDDANLKDDINTIFDSSGKIIYKNLPSSKIFSSVNQLITR